MLSHLELHGEQHDQPEVLSKTLKVVDQEVCDYHTHLFVPILLTCL